MLENVSKLTLYSYNFKEGALASAFSGMLPEWKEGEAADHGKAGERIEVGMLAQEVEAILPDAVHTVEYIISTIPGPSLVYEQFYMLPIAVFQKQSRSTTFEQGEIVHPLCVQYKSSISISYIASVI